MAKTQLTVAQKALRHAAYTAGGRQAAWTFVVQHHWDVNAIRAKLAEKETSRADPEAQHGAMASGASPRVVIDAYISVLKEAIEIVEAQQAELVAA